MTTSPQSLPEVRTAARPALLVDDDDALITDTLAFALGSDFEVHACESRASAIALLRVPMRNVCPDTKSPFERGQRRWD